MPETAVAGSPIARPAAGKKIEVFDNLARLYMAEPPRFSLRWQSSLSLGKTMDKSWRIDGEASLDVSAAGEAPGWQSLDLSGEVRPYRLWLRLSSSRLEARLGLQKINFGSATVFRPLMWFDRLGPRDPLQITDGVWGLLLRYYLKNNANIWIWGLYGNRDEKGWERQPTASRTPEWGALPDASFYRGSSRYHLFPALGRRPCPLGTRLSGKPCRLRWQVGPGDRSLNRSLVRSPQRHGDRIRLATFHCAGGRFHVQSRAWALPVGRTPRDQRGIASAGTR
jgi:hypothetical protein